MGYPAAPTYFKNESFILKNKILEIPRIDLISKKNFRAKNSYVDKSELMSSDRQVRRLSKKWQQKRYRTLKLRMLLSHTPDPSHSYRTMLSIFMIANDSIGIVSPIFFITITFFPGANLMYAGITVALFFASLIGYDFFQKSFPVNNECSKDSLISIQNKSREIISLIQDIRPYATLENTNIFSRLNKFDNDEDLSFKKESDRDLFIKNSKIFLSAAGAGFIWTKFITIGFFLTFNFASPPGMILLSSYLLYATTLTLLKNTLEQTTNAHEEKIKIEKARINRCQENDLTQLIKLKNSILNVVDINTKLSRNSSAFFHKLKGEEHAPLIGASLKLKIPLQ